MTKRSRPCHVIVGACPHCGREITTNALRRHIRRCFENPEYRAHLAAIVPAGIGSAEYARLLPALPDAPANRTIQSRFGTFAAFMLWLHGVRCPCARLHRTPNRRRCASASSVSRRTTASPFSTRRAASGKRAAERLFPGE